MKVADMSPTEKERLCSRLQMAIEQVIHCFNEAESPDFVQFKDASEACSYKVSLRETKGSIAFRLNVKNLPKVAK